MSGSYSPEAEEPDLDDFELDDTTGQFAQLLQKLSITKESISKTSKFVIIHPDIFRELFSMIFRRLERVCPLLTIFS